MLYGPTDLPTFNEFIKISISVAEEGQLKKISHYNCSNSLMEIKGSLESHHYFLGNMNKKFIKQICHLLRIICVFALTVF